MVFCLKKMKITNIINRINLTTENSKMCKSRMAFFNFLCVFCVQLFGIFSLIM